MNKVTAFELLLGDVKLNPMIEATMQYLTSMDNVKNVFVAGGYLRDQVYGVGPSKDMDIFVQVDGEDISIEALDSMPHETQLVSPSNGFATGYVYRASAWYITDEAAGYLGDLVPDADNNRKILSVRNCCMSYDFGGLISKSKVIQVITTNCDLRKHVDSFDFGINKIWHDGKKISYDIHFLQDFFNDTITPTIGLEFTSNIAMRFNRFAKKLGLDVRMAEDKNGNFHKGNYLSMAPLNRPGKVNMYLTDRMHYNICNGGRDELLPELVRDRDMDAELERVNTANATLLNVDPARNAPMPTQDDIVNSLYAALNVPMAAPVRRVIEAPTPTQLERVTRLYERVAATNAPTTAPVGRITRAPMDDNF